GLPSAGSLPKWPQQLDLSQSEARSQELLLGLPHGCRGPSTWHVAPKQTIKKQKIGEALRALSSSTQSSSSRDDNMFQVGKMRYVHVPYIKGKGQIDILEYWMGPESEMKPGRKVPSEQISDTDDAVRKLKSEPHNTCNVLVVLICLFYIGFCFQTLFSKLFYIWIAKQFVR
uniref:Uncharacterized protein n=1 Tax=Oryctolagus cuniculus TaxID=9986 RepID=A0A5F9DVB5_RABIT